MTTPDAPPDWTTTELACPLCGYNLRGLTDPRCPECGFAFRWADLLAAGRDRHPWLFEHGRGRNVRTFLSTYARTALPRRFWRTVTPANPVHVGRLIVYWLIASLPMVAIAAAPVPGQVVRLARRNLAMRALYGQLLTTAPLGGHLLTAAEVARHQAQIDAEIPAPWSVAFVRQAWSAVHLTPDRYRVAAAAVTVAWPMLSVVALLLFPASMRRAKVNVGHVMRAAVYGCDFGLLTCIVAAVVFSPAAPSGISVYAVNPRGPPTLVSLVPSGPFPPRDMPLLLVILGCAIVATYRLTIAYARYLRFDRPLLTVMAAQVVVLLSVVVVLVWTVRLF